MAVKRLKKIGKYQIIGKIGEGGMGAVYKAKHPTLKRLVIIKQLTLRGKASLIERFKREARIMLDLRNDNVVQVFDHFKEGNYYYIAMEFVDGIPLDRLVHKRRYLSNEAAILIFSEVCKGLKYAHDRNIIHRDIKPANVLISKEGEVKLTDFGIATSKEDQTFGLTRAGTTLGTPAYMPPEQIINSKNVDKRADIYAMGVMLYNMVTGKLPYPTNMSPHTIARIEKGSFVSPRELNPRISPKIQKVIRKAIRPNRKKRYKDLSVMLLQFKLNLLKYRDSKTIHHTIKKYLSGKEISSKRVSGKKFNLLSLFPIKSKKFVIFLVIALIGFSAIYQLGLFHDILLRNKYGAVKVVIESQKNQPIKNNDIKTSIYYKNKKGNLVKKRFKFFLFRKNNKKSTSKKNYYESQKIFLKTNHYFLDVEVKNEKFYNNFIVNSRAKQAKNKSTKDAKKLTFNYYNIPSFPLKINFNFHDINNNANLSNVSIKYWYDSGWIDWYSYAKRNYNNIRSGKTYYFLFSRSGYLSEKHQVEVDPYQTDLNLDIEMTHIPGVLNINTNGGNYNLSINNSKYYLNGGTDAKYLRIQSNFFDYILFKILHLVTNKESKKYKELKNAVTGKKKLVLPPGKYTLKASKFSLFSSISNSRAINIIPNGIVTLSIKYDKKKKILKIY